MRQPRLTPEVVVQEWFRFAVNPATAETLTRAFFEWLEKHGYKVK